MQAWLISFPNIFEPPDESIDAELVLELLGDDGFARGIRALQAAAARENGPSANRGPVRSAGPPMTTSHVSALE